MADTGKASISVNILPDNIKSRLTGKNNFDIASALGDLGGNVGDGWIYAEPTVIYTEADLLGTTEDYLGPKTGAAAVATGDKFRWLVIKHTGTSNGTTKTSAGVVLCLDANGSLAYNTGDAIFLAPNNIIVLKTPNTTVADLHAMTCAVSAGVPTGATSSGDNVRLIVTGILRNVA